MRVFVCRYSVVILLLTLANQVCADSYSEGSVSLGYRVDSLDWTIDGAGNPLGTSPNILSELEWRDMEILQLKGELSGSNAAGIYFRGYGNFGWVLDGVNQDSDYAESNRTAEFSRSINDVDGSRVLDLSGGLGLTFFLDHAEQYRFIPMVGLSYHNQNMQMRGGNQVVSNVSNAQLLDPAISSLPSEGPFPGLNSSYEAEWSGPWLGADMLLDLRNSGKLLLRVEKHWVNYYAKANWNLREDFDHPLSYEHKSNGEGWVLELGWQNAPIEYQWVWGVKVSLQEWDAGVGQYLVHYADGSRSVSRFNGANWSSKSVHFSLSKAFYE